MVFAIADLHLSHTSGKPMDVFGQKWENHTQKIFQNWQSIVSPDDTVIIPGDISWGMNFDSSAEDLLFIERLNGKKIIGKGNHDYWWQTMKKLNAFIDEIGAFSIKFLFNNAHVVENYIICGTRGWFTDEKYTPEDEKIVNREAGRLELSLSEAMKLKEEYPDKEIVAFLHYPPAYNGLVCDPITRVLNKYEVKRCFYGHIHSAPPERHEAYAGTTRLYCISADYINFKPMRI